MEIIDAHAHIYPSKIARKATAAVGDFYDIRMDLVEGTAETLIATGSKAGVSRYIVHSCATKPEQVSHINDFIKEEIDKYPEFIGFMTLHQDLTEEEMIMEVERCKQAGFKGVKLHPDFQKFYIDDENVDKIYRAVGSNFPILFHTGDDRYEFSKPKRLVAVAKKHPEITFIGAHFGGYRCWDDAYMYKGLKNVYFDTCSSLMFITPQKAKELIDMLGADRFFFGTDFPMWDAEKELERFTSIDLTDTERAMILSDNIKRILNI